MTREKVLQMLLAAQMPLSGEQICKELGISHAAIWKSIEQLRREGYTIEAAPRRGYLLTACPEQLDAAQIKSFLTGHPWQELVQAVLCVDSTNTVCKRLSAGGAPEGTVVLSARQTAGKGRRGRVFVSPVGGLYFSMILRPHEKPETLMHLTAMTAVAAARAVRAVCGIYPGIKWTNDLTLGGKKLCGILTEISMEAESRVVESAVIGIGINCARAPLPPEVAAMSTCLEEATGEKIDRNWLAAELIKALYEMKQGLFSEKAAWLQEFSAHCVTLGQDIKLIRGDESYPAHADGIDEDAGLLVTYPDGRTDVITSGEVSVRGMYGYV